MVCQLPNGSGLIVVILACQRIGAVPVLVLMAHRRRTLLQVLDTAAPAAIVTVPVYQGHRHASEIEMALVQGGRTFPWSLMRRQISLTAASLVCSLSLGAVLDFRSTMPRRWRTTLWFLCQVGRRESETDSTHPQGLFLMH